MDSRKISNPDDELAWHPNRGNSESWTCLCVVHGTEGYV